MKLNRHCGLHISSEPRSHSRCRWNIDVELRRSQRPVRLKLLLADDFTARTEAASRVVGNNNLGVDMLHQRASSLISGGAAQFCAPLCFLSCLQSASSPLSCYLMRPDGGGNLWMRFLGVCLVAAVFLSVFRDVPAHPGFIFTFPRAFKNTTTRQHTHCWFCLFWYPSPSYF